MFNLVLETSDFQIVDTDYENYQIGWECDEEDGKSESKFAYFVLH